MASGGDAGREYSQTGSGIEAAGLRTKNMHHKFGSLCNLPRYWLRDAAIWTLPGILVRDHSIKVSGNLRADFLALSDGKLVEINIIGEGTKEGNHVTILGEAKTQLKKRDVDKFVTLVSAIESQVPYPVVPLVITHQTLPQVKQYALEKGIIVYFSYQLRPVSTL